MTHLISVLNDIGLNLDKNIQKDVIYLDFTTAFDSANLSANAISSQLLSWFANYLSGRVQRVVLEGSSSHWALFTSGVPHGSPLGSLMFVIPINDLPDAAKGEVNTALYADNSKIFGAVKFSRDCVAVQSTVSNMEEWKRCNNIQFNTFKCKVLTLTRKKQSFSYDYTLNNAQLKHVAEEKDLGIIVTSTLSWDIMKWIGLLMSVPLLQ